MGGYRRFNSVGLVFLLLLLCARTEAQPTSQPARTFWPAYAFDGQRLIAPASEGRMGAAVMWDLQTGREMLRIPFGENESMKAAVLSADGKRVLMGIEFRNIGEGGGSARIYDVATGRELQRFNAVPSVGVQQVEFSPDEKKIVTDTGRARVWEVESGRELFVWPNSRLYLGRGEAPLISPDGNAILTGNPRPGGVSVHDMWNGVDICRLDIFAADANTVTSTAWSPDSNIIAATFGRNSLATFDSRSGKKLHSFVGHSDSVHYVSFSSDGQRIVSTSSDKSARIWDVKTGKLIQKLDHQANVDQALFNRDGTRLLTTWGYQGGSNSSSLWDTQTGREILRLTYADSYKLVGFSPNGDTFLRVGKKIELRDAASGKVIRDFAW